jgi:hypothetical protein
MLLILPLLSHVTPLHPHGLASFIHPAPESAPLLAEPEEPAESKMAFIAQNLNKSLVRATRLDCIGLTAQQGRLRHPKGHH